MRIVKTISVLIFIIMLVFFVTNLPAFIKVDKIICHSQYGRCSGALEAKLKGLEGQKLAKAKANLKGLLEDEILVDDFSSQFKLPSTLVINILERKPRFALTTFDKKQYANVDKDGRVLSLTPVSDLPVLSVDTIPSQGDFVSTQELFALRVLYDIYITFQVEEGSFGKDGLRVKFPQGQEVIFPLEGEKDILLGSAVLLLNKLREEDSHLSKLGENIGTIDLRFSNPVLR